MGRFHGYFYFLIYERRNIREGDCDLAVIIVYLSGGVKSD